MVRQLEDRWRCGSNWKDRPPRIERYWQESTIGQTRFAHLSIDVGQGEDLGGKGQIQARPTRPSTTGQGPTLDGAIGELHHLFAEARSAPTNYRGVEL